MEFVDNGSDLRKANIMTPILHLSPFRSLPRPDRFYANLASRKELVGDDEQVLEAILPEYDLRALKTSAAPGVGGRSDRFILNTTTGLKFLKRYKRTYEAEAVVHEHSIINYLADVNFPAPRLAHTVSGDTMVRRNGRSYALFDYLEGYFQYHNYLFLPSQTRQFISAAGEALGALHYTLKTFTPVGTNPNGFVSRTGGRCRELTWFTDKIKWCRKQIPRLQADGEHFMGNMLADNNLWVEQRLQSLDATLETAGLPRLIIHGDYGPYNLMFKRGAPVVIVDYELARLDWPLTDLAKSLSTFAQSRFGFNFNKAALFLQAYQKSGSVGRGEQRQLPTVWQFLTLRRLVVCWDRYCRTQDKRWQLESKRRLELFHWLEDKKVNARLGRLLD